MDPTRFDTLTRSLSTTRSRRRALSGLLAGTLGVLGWHDGDESAAHDLAAKCKKKSGEAKKKCLKKAKKHAATHTTVGVCTRNCAGKQCGPDGCGGVCGSCETCNAAGQCVCPSGQQLSGGVCGTPPTCKPAGAVCGTPECCSSYCNKAFVIPHGQCMEGSAGASCHTDADCHSGRSCVGFKCCHWCLGTCLPATCPADACGAECDPNAPACCAPLTCQEDSPMSYACYPP